MNEQASEDDSELHPWETYPDYASAVSRAKELATAHKGLTGVRRCDSGWEVTVSSDLRSSLRVVEGSEDGEPDDELAENSAPTSKKFLDSRALRRIAQLSAGPYPVIDGEKGWEDNRLEDPAVALSPSGRGLAVFRSAKYPDPEDEDELGSIARAFLYTWQRGEQRNPSRESGGYTAFAPVYVSQSEVAGVEFLGEDSIIAYPGGDSPKRFDPKGNFTGRHEQPAKRKPRLFRRLVPTLDFYAVHREPLDEGLPSSSVEFGFNIEDYLALTLPTRRLCVVPGSEKGIYVIDVLSGQVLSRLGEDMAPARTLALASDKELVVSGHTDGRLALWNLMSDERLVVRQAHEEQISSVAVSEDTRYIATVTDSGLEIGVWEVDLRQLYPS